LKRQQLYQAATAAAADEDDDYEPDYEPLDVGADASEEAIAIAAEDAELERDLVSLGAFVLPQPPPLTEEEAGDVGRSAVSRVFGMIDAVETTPSPAQSKTQQQLGFARLAGSTFDRDAWVTLLTRLATRAPAGLEGGDKFKGELATGRRQPTISDSIRETLYRYILEDFRARLKIGITWLNEEWYNDRVRMKAANSERGDEDEEPTVALFYDTWVLRLLDGLLPYLDSRDIKVLVRFLSEIPEVTIAITQRVASLAKDPERVNLTVQALM
jgi:symplekin